MTFDRMTLADLRSALDYDPVSGNFTWKLKTNRRIKTGAIAGTIAKHGYVHIKFMGKVRIAHRLAWFYMTGEYPPCQIDHVDGNRANNALCNLRLADFSENGFNKKLTHLNTSGVKGVYLHRPSGRFIAQIVADKKYYYLGYFDNIEDAECAVRKKRQELHGEFTRHE